jgi:hypothetical protein
MASGHLGMSEEREIKRRRRFGGGGEAVFRGRGVLFQEGRSLNRRRPGQCPFEKTPPGQVCAVVLWTWLSL